MADVTRSHPRDEKQKTVIVLDEDEVRALTRLLASRVIGRGEECPMLTDLAVALGSPGMRFHV